MYWVVQSVLNHYFIPRMDVEPMQVGNEQYAFRAGRVRREQQRERFILPFVRKALLSFLCKSEIRQFWKSLGASF